MPSRFAFFSNREEIEEKFNASCENIEIHPYYNLKPTNRATGIINEDGLKVVRLKWGFIKGNQFYKVRAESIHEKPMFNKAFQERRCAILTNGFFEWEKEDKKSIPYYFTVKDQSLFTIAGIYNTHVEKESGETKYQCAVVTTEANELVGKIFHRMPVIFTKSEMNIWLNTTESQDILLKLLKPYPSEEMTNWKVNQLPAKGDNGPDTIAPFREKKVAKKPGLTDFF
jgi:putative SOS response-associated peptidase YedK